MSARSANLVAIAYEPKRVDRLRKLIFDVLRHRPADKCVIVVTGPSIDADSLAARFAGIEAGAIQVIRHEGEGAEFGGYQAGISALDDALDGDLFIVNDTAGSHQYFSKFYIDALCRESLTPEGDYSVWGRIDACETRLGIDHLYGERWVRSNLFCIGAAALRAIGGKIYDPELAGCVAGGWSEDEFFGPRVSPELQMHLRRWLFGEVGYRWYGAARLSEQNAELFKRKALSILQEKALSFRMEEQRIAFRGPRLERWPRLSDRIAHKFHKSF